MTATKIHKHLGNLLQNSNRYNFLKGGRWSTKSHTVAEFIEMRCSSEPNLIAKVGREFQNSIKDSNFQLIKNKCEQSPYASEYQYAQTEILNKVTGSRIQFAGLKVSRESIKGWEDIDIFWGEESQRLSQDSVDILRPTIRKPGSQLFFTWNPTWPDDPIELLEQSIPEESKLVIECHWTDLWTKWQTEDLFLEQKTTVPEMYGHIWDGEYRPVGTVTPFGYEAIVNAFAREHVVPTRPHTINGVDLAYTDTNESDYTACVKVDAVGQVLAAIHFREVDYDERLRKIDEFCGDSFFTLVDDTEGLGRATVKDLAGKCHRSGVMGYTFSQKSKQDLVTNTAKRLSDGTTSIKGDSPGHIALYNELRKFVQTKTGKFEAEVGHDDLACAYMLALEGLRRKGW